MDLNQSIHHLQHNGILIYPTDTVYGIGCLVSSSSSNQLTSIKPRKTGFIVISDCWEKCLYLIAERIDVTQLNRENPTTWVFDASKEAPANIKSNKNTIAIRVVTHEPTMSLLKSLSEPLISTSANLPGKKAPIVARDIDQSALPFPIMDGENGSSEPSHIIIYRNGQRLR